MGTMRFESKVLMKSISLGLAITLGLAGLIGWVVAAEPASRDGASRLDAASSDGSLVADGASADAAAPAVAAPTFNRDIAPILFKNCSSCHHPGEVAPFSLLTYADAHKHSTEMADLTLNRQMPPWKPEHGFGEFLGERRLAAGDIATIQNWVKTGRPEGDPADLPAPPKYVEGWMLGEPDLVLKVPKAYTLRADGPDVMRSFVIPLDLPEDKYVEAVEFRPANRKIVHHALLFIDSTGRARAQDGADGKPGFGRGGGLGFVPSGGLGGWAPGMVPHRMPDGVARILRKDSDLVIQTHFHPSGKVETEQSTVGLYFAKRTPSRIFVSHMRIAGGGRLNVAAGEKNYEIKQTFTVPADVKLQAIFPHAHLICKEIEVKATFPDGKTVPLIWIKNWDWDWQDDYFYVHPLDIPRGTQVSMRFRYDNSEDNLKNPASPPAGSIGESRPPTKWRSASSTSSWIEPPPTRWRGPRSPPAPTQTVRACNVGSMRSGAIKRRAAPVGTQRRMRRRSNCVGHNRCLAAGIWYIYHRSSRDMGYGSVLFVSRSDDHNGRAERLPGRLAVGYATRRGTAGVPLPDLGY